MEAQGDRLCTKSNQRPAKRESRHDSTISSAIGIMFLCAQSTTRYRFDPCRFLYTRFGSRLPENGGAKHVAKRTQSLLKSRDRMVGQS